MPELSIPTSRARNYKSEPVDTKESISMPDRNPGRIPSLATRPPVQPKRVSPTAREPIRNIPLKMEGTSYPIDNDLGLSIPSSPLSKKAEKLPNLSELI